MMQPPSSPSVKQELAENSLGAELRLLTVGELRFNRNAGKLCLTVAKRQSWLAVRLVRAFPYSAGQRYLSVLDNQGGEIGLIMDPDELDAESRALVEEELARRYRMPRIRLVYGVRERFGTQEWQASTDQGYVRFSTRHLFDNVRVGSDGIILTDVDGNRYIIPADAQLEAASRRLLDSSI